MSRSIIGIHRSSLIVHRFMSYRQRIDQIVDGHFDKLVALRRHLHAHPEPSGEELETSLKVYQLLGDAGVSVRMGPEGRGVLADSGDQSAGKRIALRGDIDALRIQDEKQSPYRSTRDGVMHACGHDAHTTCLVGALLALHQLAEEDGLPCPVTWRGIFQPSEETATGAVEMVEAGVAEAVDAFLALHVDPRLETGAIGIRPGVLTAYAEMIQIDVHGSGSHAARPHESHDPIAAAAQLISTIYQYIPRSTDSQETVVVPASARSPAARRRTSSRRRSPSAAPCGRLLPKSVNERSARCDRSATVCRRSPARGSN